MRGAAPNRSFANAQEVRTSHCRENSPNLGRAAADSDWSNGSSCLLSLAKDHRVLSKPCGLNYVIRSSADADIELSRG